MSSILAGLDNQILLEQRTYKLWENAGHKIVEAQLTADQIKQLFANVEQGATDAGGNRTLIGKGKDAAGAVNTAWEDLKSKVYNSGPMNNFAAAYDKQAEKLKQATGGDQGVFKYVQKYRDFAEKHPIIQGFVYAALIAAAGVTGAGLGGAAVLGLFKLTDQLLQGKDIRSAIYQGAKTGALAYGASKLGDLVTGRNTPVTAKSSKTTWDAVDQGFVKPQGAGGGLPGGGTTSGGETWSATLRGITGDQIKNHPDYATYIQKYGDTVNGRKMAQAMVKNAIAKGQAMAGQGTYNVTNEGIELNEATIKILLSKVSLEHSKRIDEGIMDTLKGAAGKAMDYAKTKGHNLTTKITADKLNTAWEKAGKPTDSDQIATILKSTGVPEDVVKNVFAQMKIPVAAAPAAGQQPAQGAAPAGAPAKPAQPVKPAAQQPAAAQAAAPAQPAAAPQAAPAQQPAAQAAQAAPAQQPAQKPGKPVIKQPSVASNRTAGVRQQGGTFAYNPLAEDAEKVAQLEAAMRQAQQITRAIKYDDSTTEIIVKIQELASKTGIDPRSVKYAISDVYEAKNALESAVYGLDELFKNAYQDAKLKHDDEEEGFVEEGEVVSMRARKNEGYSAGASGGAGLGEKINTPGGMGQSYRKHGQGPSGLKKEKIDELSPELLDDVDETAIPMFTPETKMVNANDPGSNGWKVYKAKPSGILEGIITEYDTNTIDAVVRSLPKGLTINNFTIPAFKEFLFQKYANQMKSGWDKLYPFFKKEYNDKHGIKEYKQDPYAILSGDLNFFDDMLLVLPKGLEASELYKRAFQEFLYKKFADKEWQKFKENRYTYWDAYQKLSGNKQSMFGKLKSKIGMESSIMKGLTAERKIDEYDIDSIKRK